MLKEKKISDYFTATSTPYTRLKSRWCHSVLVLRQISWWPVSGSRSIRSQWRENSLILFNTSKTKLLPFHNHQADDNSAPILMSTHTLKDVPYLESQLGLKLTPGLKWDAYIRFHRRRCSKIGWLLVSPQKIHTFFH